MHHQRVGDRRLLDVGPEQRALAVDGGHFVPGASARRQIARSSIVPSSIPAFPSSVYWPVPSCPTFNGKPGSITVPLAGNASSTWMPSIQVTACPPRWNATAT